MLWGVRPWTCIGDREKQWERVAGGAGAVPANDEGRVRKRPKFGPAILRSVRSSAFVSLALKMICGSGGGRRACGAGWGEGFEARDSPQHEQSTRGAPAAHGRDIARRPATAAQRKEAPVGTSARALAQSI